MQNLEQIRAAAALAVAYKTTKADVSKLPALILSNGLLAAAAFANEDEGKKRPKMAAVVTGLAEHLSNPTFGFESLRGCKKADSMIDSLTKADSIELQRATAEALAFVGYVKRFARKGDSNAEE
jgi:CRISPR/Cas system CMR-associated protein Cmr5 small subunit